MVVGSPHRRRDNGDAVIAQYLVTKVSWKRACKRILTVTSTHLLTYNPESYQCTSQWDLSEIEDVEVTGERDQFLLRLEKSRFRLTKVRFQCAARSHFMSLITKLRRHFTTQPAQFSIGASDARGGAPWNKYRCVEFFGDGSSSTYYLQVGVAAVLLLNDNGEKMDAFPFIYLKKAASTYSHPDGIVLGSPYQERLFLCSQRNECLGDMYVAAGELGVDLRWEESPLNVQLLRLRNSQMIDQPAVVCFEVRKTSEDGKSFMDVQLILQGEALVEVHPKMRSVVARKYTTLFNIIRAEWDPQTVGLEFAEGESVVVRLEARDQLITLLLLTCRENGHEHVMLTATEIKKNRVYYPHVNDKASESAAAKMENFFLHRVLQTAEIMSEHVIPAYGGSTPHVSGGLLLRKQSTPENGWLRRQRRASRLQKRSEPLVHGGTRDSFETGDSMNDFISTNIAMEELNANIPLNETILSCHKEVLNDAIELLADHLASLVSSLRRYVDTVNAEIVTTLQALVRLCYSSIACLSDRMVMYCCDIIRAFDAVLELLVQRDYLTSYWCLKLLQCFFNATSRVELTADSQRLKVLQHVAAQNELLSAIIDLLPSSSPISSRSSGYWLLGSDGVMAHMSHHASLDSTLQSKEARLEKDMNIVYYEALTTAHQIIMYLHEKERQEQLGANNTSIRGGKQQLLREFIPKRNPTLGPRRKTMPAAAYITRTDSDDINAGVFSKQKRLLTEKLLEKHEFLMDSVVDTRLVRAAQTSVLLMKFLTLELRRDRSNDSPRGSPWKKKPGLTSGDGSSSRKAVVNQSSSTESGANETVGGGSDQQQDKRRDMRRGATVANFQGIQNPDEAESQVTFPDVSLDDVLARKLSQLDEFLESYAAKIRTQNNRSHLFKGERMIHVPLTGFSQSSDEIIVSERTDSLDRMKLEHLEILGDEENSSGKDEDDDEEEEEVHEIDEFNLGFQNDSSAPHSSDVLPGEELRPQQERESSDLFRSSTFDFESENEGQQQPCPQHNYVPERRQRSRNKGLARSRHSQSTPAMRVRAVGGSHCDACIGCNDVCDNVMCFFCSEKKYQLQAAFPGSSPSSRRGGGARDPYAQPPSNQASSQDDYVATERKYSSCEVQRHRSLRSCWVIVDGDVFNITDLLSVHPGGLQVLLQAAQHGEDCGPILDEHPPSARHFLSHYRLGEYYECETRTLPS
ncbi:Cytochrome b5 isoform b, partial [Globisporangium splendens]